MESLQHHNILKDTKVAPAIQGPQRALERNLARANLYHALKGRPTVEELHEQGIYRLSPEDEAEWSREHEEWARQAQAHQAAQRAQQRAASQPAASAPDAYQRKSKNFHLTRILLKFAASMSDSGEISATQKGFLKDLIVDQDTTILAIADQFDADNDVQEFKQALLQLAASRQY
jgi:hypothetical protein